jgi:hypothetical protein
MCLGIIKQARTFPLCHRAGSLMQCSKNILYNPFENCFAYVHVLYTDTVSCINNRKRQWSKIHGENKISVLHSMRCDFHL